MKRPIYKWTKEKLLASEDLIAIEEPLEIRIRANIKGRIQEIPLVVTMRTPGNEEELTLGFLYSEGIIQKQSHVIKIEKVPTLEKLAINNVLLVTIDPQHEILFDLKGRNFLMHSSCGVCGKTSIASVVLKKQDFLEQKSFIIEASLIQKLPSLLDSHQIDFQKTGGMHASWIFDSEGNCLNIQEDVGRHNALDKAIGFFLKKEVLPLNAHILFLSGRVSFELVQKASMAGIPILCSLGAPSTLAIDLAEEMDITLVGFVKNDQFNIYNNSQRIKMG